MLISQEEWKFLSAAVSQRARAMNLMLSDIYGPRRLLQTGDLPPEIVLANPAFIRAAHELRPADGIYLHLYAVDLARSPDGRWWVIGDRTDTPSGAGYALENRIVMNRVHPELVRTCQIQRLARFFQQMRDGLLARASVTDREPRVVIYTPGPYHSTYFEQAYLARYLGFNLVEGRDLTVRDQGVFLKTLSGLIPVDVILRRVDSDFCDPLELRGESLLGVPGLLQSARSGNVVVANTIGSGVIETPALLSFLPQLCRRLLGEELMLPPLATWWCGQADALASVMGQLDRLVVKQAYSSGNAPAILPGQVPRDEMIARLKRSPHLYVGQEYVALSTAPTWQDQRLEPYHLIVRLYAAAVGPDEYIVMPGGLTRTGNSSDSILLSAQTGGISKDTWILSDTPPDPTTLLPTHTRSSQLSRAGFVLPSRLADDLYWLGRYVERIDFGCRLSRCLLQRMNNETDFGQPTELLHLIGLLEAHGRLPENWAARSSAELQDLLVAVVVEEGFPNGIVGDVAKVHRIAMGVRDRLSVDAWRILTELGNTLVPTPTVGHDLDGALLPAISQVLEKLSAFGGQAADGMTRDAGWMFLDIGRRLERVTDLADLLLHSVVDPNPGESTRLLAVLEIANSAMTYQSRYVFGPDVARVLDLLLSDETNPRSITFQLATLYRHVRALRVGQPPRSVEPEVNLVMNTYSEVRLLDVDAVALPGRRGRRDKLASRLEQITRSMKELSSLLTRTYLTHVQPPRQLGARRR